MKETSSFSWKETGIKNLEPLFCFQKQWSSIYSPHERRGSRDGTRQRSVNQKPASIKGLSDPRSMHKKNRTT